MSAQPERALARAFPRSTLTIGSAGHEETVLGPPVARLCSRGDIPGHGQVPSDPVHLHQCQEEVGVARKRPAVTEAAPSLPDGRVVTLTCDPERRLERVPLGELEAFQGALKVLSEAAAVNIAWQAAS